MGGLKAEGVQQDIGSHPYHMRSGPALPNGNSYMGFSTLPRQGVFPFLLYPPLGRHKKVDVKAQFRLLGAFAVGHLELVPPGYDFISLFLLTFFNYILPPPPPVSPAKTSSLADIYPNFLTYSSSDPVSFYFLFLDGSFSSHDFI
ncbi:uncharacterized protein LOC111474474 [Cucurbita maxima]|uniref:Uncharacterized protein LOC111474474 n=1 Tax=Cucurbita maxima TaxID=3661 RepID=A0A6J1IIU6_CUCMA|nr:uncharacterized protein LOC111474474 [Cucurbita maxima]